MLSILPTTNHNTNFKAAQAKPNIEVLEKQITAIVKDEVIIPKNAVKNVIPNIDKRLSFWAKISALPLIGVVANYYIEKIDKQIEQEAKRAQLEKTKRANALKVDWEGKTMAYRVLEKIKQTKDLEVDSEGKTMLEKEYEIFFEEIVKKYPDVLLVRTKQGRSCLMCAVWYAPSLVNFIASKLVSNPNYDPNRQYESEQLVYNEELEKNDELCKKGDTDTHILARFGKLDAIKKIISHPNIDLSICNDKDQTPIDVALETKNDEIVNFLATQM